MVAIMMDLERNIMRLKDSLIEWLVVASAAMREVNLIYRRLRQGLSLRQRLTIFLFITRILSSFKKSSDSQWASCHLAARAKHEKLRPTATISEKTSHHKSSKNAFSTSLATDPNQAQRPFPYGDVAFRKFLPYMMFFEHLTSCIYIYLVLKQVLPLELLIRYFFEPTKPAHCFLPGRLYLNLGPVNWMMGQTTSLMIASIHLCWRWSQHNRVRPNTYNLFLFLLAKDEDVEHYYLTLLEGRDNANAATTVHDEYFLQLLCYQVHYKTHTKYRIRANRNQSARQTLRYQSMRGFRLSAIMFLILVMIFSPPILLIISSDLGHAINYPGCFPEQERLLRENKLSLWSFTPNNYYWLCFLFDFCECALWLDSASAITFVLAATFLMNYDLVFCWRSMQRRLEISAHRLKLYWHKSGVHKKKGRLVHKSTTVGTRPAPGFYTYYNDARDERTQILTTEREHPYDNLRLVESLDIEDMICEIQGELCDCFKQIEAVDMQVSDLLSTAVIIWLSTYALFTYYSRGNALSYLIFVPQIYGFIAFTMFSAFLMKLRRTTCRSYVHICSLMAHDRSRHKRNFIKILDYYTGRRNRSSYTLFHQKPYIPTTYLTIVGWTFTVTTIAESLLRI